ncbi:Phosphatidate phosphatase APP1 [Sanguibacter gelidistatuariae]|uniref:Phosphatidate phosphatase APP1 n=1 Tax=Sanguibacter gelidistatuariae TaxID=1814289 RepID=A0A1G6H1Y7_9MICO|nr:phosphatase domain-containing protein [Sanguibacter gelidistatuariae]SDB88163.1 Phosphatidate phosphatase APP1 [Sanguibacter gelidistatuariae]
MGTEASSRPHWAGRWESRFDRGLATALRRRGWSPRVEPYAGYGLAPGADPGWIRVLARVMLAPAPSASGGNQASDPTAQPKDSAPQLRRRRARMRTPETLRAVRGWRSFVTAQLPGTRVQVVVGGAVHEVLTDRGGYIDVTLPATLGEGWHDVRILPEGGPAVLAPVRVISTRPCTGLLSDVDDTVMVTMLPRPLSAIWNLLVLHEDARLPVPGMSQLYAELGGLDAAMPVVYLSTNAWNVAPALRRFLAHHRFPAGPLLLTDWGPTNTGLFRSGPEHKRQALDRLAAELPHIRWVLVGDDGQRDPQIYRDFARAHPSAVRAVVIRELSSSEHVFAHGAPTAADAARPDGGTVTGTTVPEVRGPDGQTLARRLRAAGILPLR